MSPTRLKAQGLLEPIPEGDTNSNGGTNPKGNELFHKYTNVWHVDLVNMWNAGNKHTCCIDFVSWYASSMGRPGLDFRMADLAGSAFIRPSSNLLPQYGDVFKLNRLHVGVCLDCDGNTWNVVEAGQGGPNTHYDILRRHEKPYDPADVEGWTDIELWLDPTVRVMDAVRFRLRGKWFVEIEKRQWVYTFTFPNAVTYRDPKVRSAVGNGTWAADDQNVTVNWDEATTEVWPVPLPAMFKTGTGTTTDRAGVQRASSFKKWEGTK